MFASLKIAAIVVILATGALGYMYVQKLQSDLQTARENVAKMEIAVQTSEASIELLKQDAAKMAELNSKLQSDLQKAEAYGDELRSKLARHNLTALALRKPGLIEGRMNGATAKLWREIEQATGGSGDTPLPPWLQQSRPVREAGTGDQSSNQDRKDDSAVSGTTETSQSN